MSTAWSRTIRSLPATQVRLNGSIAWFYRSRTIPITLQTRARNLDASYTAKTLRRWATSTTPHSYTTDLAELEAERCHELATSRLEDGDMQGAKEMYKRSCEIKPLPSSLFNLGVTHYHLKEFDEAIAAWKQSIVLQPDSPDAHTNLASAYITSAFPRPDLALKHLNIASQLAPDDPEIAFNFAAVLEASGKLEEALVHYKRSKEKGVERAAVHILNVSAKLLGRKMNAAADGSEKPVKSD